MSRVESKRSRRSKEPEVEVSDNLSVEDLEEMLKIDAHALEDEVGMQSDLFYRVGEKLALAVSRRDEAKQDLQDIEAETELSIRKKSSEDGVKMTVDEVKATVRTDRNVRNAQIKLFRLTEITSKLTALRDAFAQRSSMLKKMVDLYVTNYYTNSEYKTSDSAVRNSRAERARKDMDKARRAHKESTA